MNTIMTRLQALTVYVQTRLFIVSIVVCSKVGGIDYELPVRFYIIWNVQHRLNCTLPCSALSVYTIALYRQRFAIVFSYVT